jgi:DNA-binding NarL/FixJ family response regulator
MDINMPVLDGYETTKWIKENKPLIKVLALSMYDDEKAIMKMLRNGARGYILQR